MPQPAVRSDTTPSPHDPLPGPLAAGALPPVPGLLALEGGLVLHGALRGAPLPADGDIVFTTASTGWGEILTDPSYAGQIVVLTHPMAGNYRIVADELESARVRARALIVSRLVTPPAGDGATLEQLMVEAGIPALTGVDTRALTLALRRGAARRGVIRPAAAMSDEAAVAAAREVTPWEAIDHVSRVATRQPYTVAAVGVRRARAVLFDYGVKRSLLTAIAGRGVEIVVLPADAGVADVEAQAPDIVVLAPGPGDPSRMTRQISTVRQLGRRAIDGGPPILGVCLGHQLLALAAGAETRRLAVGHHGGNHAVIEAETGRVDIGAHNHEIAVLDGPALSAAGYRVSHRDLNDRTVEGLVHASGRIASVQFHPEGAPGPIDAARVFDLALGVASAR
ncbi:MAG TPA: glutamine-hydrolyzing carbamoyl-phosphate synthase small subunit [Candidatus Limnocylindria bacterium]|nr:glutamine-hydrolyzing carbamoyl-phosphate synthase small subunit [Candidatus Limnocylindria bacterium]